jgi:hypothetical protein
MSRCPPCLRLAIAGSLVLTLTASFTQPERPMSACSSYWPITLLAAPALFWTLPGTAAPLSIDLLPMIALAVPEVASAAPRCR